MHSRTQTTGTAWVATLGISGTTPEIISQFPPGPLAMELTGSLAEKGLPAQGREAWKGQRWVGSAGSRMLLVASARSHTHE